MNKSQVLKKIHSFGDALVEFYPFDKASGLYVGEEPVVCTIDLSTKYIKDQLRRSKRAKRAKNLVYAWSWSDNDMVALDPKKIQRITPLSKILNNEE